MVLISSLLLTEVIGFHTNAVLDDKVKMIKFFDDNVFMIEFSGTYTSEC